MGNPPPEYHCQTVPSPSRPNVTVGRVAARHVHDAVAARFGAGGAAGPYAIISNPVNRSTSARLQLRPLSVRLRGGHHVLDVGLASASEAAACVGGRIRAFDGICRVPARASVLARKDNSKVLLHQVFLECV